MWNGSRDLRVSRRGAEHVGPATRPGRRYPLVRVGATRPHSERVLGPMVWEGIQRLGRPAARRWFDLVNAAKKSLATYSGGMRRRLDLAMTLVGRPRIIFLDEPTTGLDPRSRHTLWQIIRDLVAGGDTIFLTTQYLEEADQLADSIAALDHGKARRAGNRNR